MYLARMPRPPKAEVRGSNPLGCANLTNCCFAIRFVENTGCSCFKTTASTRPNSERMVSMNRGRISLSPMRGNIWSTAMTSAINNRSLYLNFMIGSQADEDSPSVFNLNYLDNRYLYYFILYSQISYMVSMRIIYLLLVYILTRASNSEPMNQH